MSNIEILIACGLFMICVALFARLAIGKPIQLERHPDKDLVRLPGGQWVTKKELMNHLEGKPPVSGASSIEGKEAGE